MCLLCASGCALAAGRGLMGAKEQAARAKSGGQGAQPRPAPGPEPFGRSSASDVPYGMGHPPTFLETCMLSCKIRASTNGTGRPQKAVANPTVGQSLEGAYATSDGGGANGARFANATSSSAGGESGGALKALSTRGARGGFGTASAPAGSLNRK